MSTSASPSRLRRAREGGVRLESAWLAAGVACVALAGALRWSRASLDPSDGPVIREIADALRQPDLELDRAASTIADVAAAGLATLLALALVVLAASVLAAVVLGRLGPIRPALARGLGLAPVPQRLRIAVGGAVLVAVVAGVELRSRIAGAARAADATQAALGAAWFDGGVATLMAVGLAMIAAGAIEAWQLRADQQVAAIPTPEQAADEARRSGGRRP